MRTLTIEQLTDLDIVLRVARDLWEKHGKQSVVIKNFDESLSEKQRRLWWLWVGTICVDVGDTKDDFHEQAKSRIFLPIFLRNPENHQNLCDAVATMRGIRNKATAQEYAMIRKYIVCHISHLDATASEMREALTQLESEAISLGIVLPKPEDVYYQSMGLKRK